MKQWPEHPGVEQSRWKEEQTDYEFGVMLAWVVGMEREEGNKPGEKSPELGE